MKSAAANPVTPEAVEKLSAYVKKWQRLLNLDDWRIHRSSVRKKGVMADLPKIDLEQRLAVYRVGVDFGDDVVTDQTLEETALHECLHIFVAELIEAARLSDASPDALRSAEHRVINVLEQRLLHREK